MLDPSDLSHLTPAEQNQILEVIRRQQDEEEKEKKMIQSLCDDFENYKSCIRINTERRPTDGNNAGDDDPVCSLCSKTKFAEGSGYLCSLCNTRFCSRCGGKITVRSNKTVWVCNVCRKQKEILAKSGAWFYGNGQIEWDSKSISGSEKENIANHIGDHNSRKSSNSSWEPSEKSQSAVLQRLSDGVVTSAESVDAALAGLHLTKPNSPVKSFLPHSKSIQSLPVGIPSSKDSSPRRMRDVSHFHNSSADIGGEASRERHMRNVPADNVDPRCPRPKERQVPSEGHRSSRDASSGIDRHPHHKSPFKSSSAIISRNTHPNYREQSGAGSLTSFDEEIRSATDFSSCASDFDFSMSRRSALSEQSSYPTTRRRREGVAKIETPAQSSSDYSPSADGMFLIGSMTLNKKLDGHLSESMLGLKVVGGKSTPSGRYAAFITKIQRGSLADTVGHLKPGDEIISWNNHCLQDLFYDEVHDIVLDSRLDSSVDLVVSRPIKETPRISCLQPSTPSTCSMESTVSSGANLGLLHMKIWHDQLEGLLYVTVLSASNLPMRGRGLPRNPYVKMYLLPDRSIESKRKTKLAKKTLNPEWRQTFQYQFLDDDEIETLSLELTVWDWDQSLDGNHNFIGEVIVDLGLICLDDEPHTFVLKPVGHGMDQNYPALTDRSTSTTQLVSNDICDSSTNGVRDNLSSHSSKSATKRRLPPLPNEADRVRRQDAVECSSQNASESDFKEAPRSLANGRHEGTDGNPDTTTIYDTLQAFVGGTGPGQVVGRQTLGVSPVGEIEVGFKLDRGKYLVHIVQAYDLSCRPTARSMPGFYVKVCMMDDMRRIAKQKTGMVMKSLSPRFQQTLRFEPQQKGNIVQVIVIAVYSRIEGKAAAGVAEISLQKLNLRTKLIGRYKLFPTSQLDSRQWTRHHSVSSSFGSKSLVQ